MRAPSAVVEEDRVRPSPQAPAARAQNGGWSASSSVSRDLQGHGLAQPSPNRSSAVSDRSCSRSSSVDAVLRVQHRDAKSRRRRASPTHRRGAPGERHQVVAGPGLVSRRERPEGVVGPRLDRRIRFLGRPPRQTTVRASVVTASRGLGGGASATSSTRLSAVAPFDRPEIAESTNATPVMIQAVFLYSSYRERPAELVLLGTGQHQDDVDEHPDPAPAERDELEHPVPTLPR